MALGALGGGVVLVGRNTGRRDWGKRSRAVAMGNWTGLAVSGVLTIVLVVVLVVRPTDASAGVNGQVGVTVSATGSPVLVVEVCFGGTSTLDIVGRNRGGAPNRQLVQFDAAATVTSSVQVDVSGPPAGWVARPGASLSTVDPGELVIASGHGPRSELRQVDFTAADLRSLDGATVLYSDLGGRHQVSAPGFHAVACP